jgi:small subunit ribosomal protein S6
MTELTARPSRPRAEVVSSSALRRLYATTSAQSDDMVHPRGPRSAAPAHLRMALRPEVRYAGEVARVDSIRFLRRNDATHPPVADRLQPFKSEGGGLVTHQYELMVILDPEIDERTVAPSLDKFLNVIRNDGGTIDNVDIWGRRRLAYEINKKTEGIYAVVNFTAESKSTDELDRQLKLSEAVMRTKVLRAEEGFALVAAEKKRAEAKAERAAKAPAKAAPKDA